MSDEELKPMSERVLGDYDIWYEPCGRCGYDTGKSTKENVKRCWKCGNRIHRDYSDRALKENRSMEQTS